MARQPRFYSSIKLTYNHCRLHSDLIHILNMIFGLHGEVVEGNTKLVTPKL